MIGVLFGKLVLAQQPVNLRSASVEIDQMRMTFNGRRVVSQRFLQPARVAVSHGAKVECSPVTRKHRKERRPIADGLLPLTHTGVNDGSDIESIPISVVFCQYRA